jgi:hypothetical protein
LYLSFGLLEEAAVLALELIGIQRQMVGDEHKRSWLPFPAIDHLLRALSLGATESAGLKVLLEQLNAQLHNELLCYSQQLEDQAESY